MEGPFVQSLPEDIRDGIARHGIRNSHLTAIAPGRHVSLLANNIQAGSSRSTRFATSARFSTRTGRLRPSSSPITPGLWRELRGPAPLPPAFVCAHAPGAHLAMPAALQPYVDSSISKTINVPDGYPFEEFQRVDRLAYEAGLKGCTTFRPSPMTGEILKGGDESKDAPHCCVVEREAD